MERIETASSELETSEKEGRALTRRLDEEEQAFGEREKALVASGAELRAARDAALARLEPALVERYEKILSRRQPAVVIIHAESCMGCRVDIPPQAYIEIRRGEMIISCAFCHRILIHRDQLQAPPRP
jgi:predicted  nucleic acid-binding Zn-ribbon protein